MGIYGSHCYVSGEKRKALEALAKELPLHVLSNFKVEGGIARLLERCGVGELFAGIHTSMEAGWRKPHPRTYAYLAERTGFAYGETLFVGDDRECDYLAPRALGMQALWYRQGVRTKGPEEIGSFLEIGERLGRGGTGQ
nr:HAD family hydrolase [Anaerotalea alkaliphila]